MNPQLLYSIIGVITFAAIIVTLGAVITPTNFSNEMALMPPQTQSYIPVPPQVMYGKLRRTWFSYTFKGDGSEAFGTFILALGIVPKNSRCGIGRVFSSAGPGINTTFDLGLVARDGSGVLDTTTNALENEANPYEGGLPAPAATADTGNLFGNFAPANAAAAGTFCDTPANKIGFYTRKDALLICTVKVANVTAAFTLNGFLDYVVD